MNENEQQKNNMKRLAAISLAVMGIMLVFALFDAARMNREIKEPAEDGQLHAAV